MDKDTFQRGAAVFASGYIHRLLETIYNQLMDLPFMARLKTANLGSKYAVEAILYALTAFAEKRMADTSPLGLLIKTVLMDAAPEIAARLLRDARADLGSAATASQQPDQSIASRILALGDAELLRLLLSIEGMDASTRAKFLAFAQKASDSELLRFVSLTAEQRKSLLGMHGDPQAEAGATSLKSFMKDFWVVAQAGGQKTAEVSLPILSRYLVVILEVLKTSATLLAVALVVCTASTLFGRWSLFALVLGLLGVSAALAYIGRQTQKSWLSVAGIVSGAVMALLAMLVASGYPDAVFGIAVFFLVGLPMLAIVAVLIPATTASEILRNIFPDAHRTLVRAFQMLLAALVGVVFSSMILLIFPPQTPVAFLFIVPSVLVTAVAVGVGLSRIGPEAVFRTPVILGLGAVTLVAMGLMSMPNLRQAMRKLPARMDVTLVAAPTPVTFATSNDIDFVATKDGEVRIWYAERADGGYDLFRSEGVGPYYAKDGRRLNKADNDSIRLKIAASVDREAAAKADALRKTDLAATERKAEEKRRSDREATERAAALRQSEQERAEQGRLAAQRLAEQSKAAQVLADKERRAGYLYARGLPAKVDFVVSAATVARVPMDTFAAALVKYLVRRGKTASNIVLSPAFITAGAFDSFFAGRGGADLQDMPVSTMGSRLFLARISVNSVKPGMSAIGLLSASVVVAFSVLSSQDGSIVDGFELKAVGAGTSEADAISNALDRILGQLGEHGY